MRTTRILVVDDEPSVTRNLKLNLEAIGGSEVFTENDPANVLAAAKACRPDLILMDVMMPGMDGGDVATLLRQDPQFRNTPLIFLTAIVSNAETGGHQWLSGADVFLAKPVETSELITCIERGLAAAPHPTYNLSLGRP